MLQHGFIQCECINSSMCIRGRDAVVVMFVSISFS